MEDNFRDRKPILKMFFALILFIVIVAALFGGIYVSNHIFGDNSSVEFDKNNVRLEDDFYSSVNYSEIKKMKIPASSSSWSKFHDAQLTVNTNKEKLILEILEDPDFSNENMEKYLELYEDYSARNKRGLTELQPYFEMIDNAKTIEEFNEILLTLDHDLNSGALYSFGISEDLYDSTKNILYFTPITIEENFEIYTLDKFSRYKEEYEKYRKNLLKLAGFTEKEIDSFQKELYEFINTVQSKSIVLSEVSDPLEVYNKYTIEDIKKNFKNIPVLQFLQRYNLDDQDFYIFYDMNHYIALDNYYNIDNLEFFKMLEKLTILERVGVYYTTDEMLNLQVELDNKIMGYTRDILDYKYEVITNIKQTSIQDELATMYEEKYFTDEDKNEIKEIIEEVRKYYKEIISECEWLGESTKEEALKKLSSIKVNIGYSGQASNTSKLQFVSKEDGGTIISNHILENRYVFDTLVDDLNSDSEGYVFDDFEVNASYNSLDNSINFTAAFKELYGNEDNYFRILGYVGTAIGHEMSHAFDLSGSKFDENGSVRDWWTIKDKENYEKLTEKIIAYYNSYKISKYNVDGKKTLSENIADLSAMKCMMKIMKEKKATEEDYKIFFEAYANLWASKEKDEAIEYGVLNDVHSPNKIRVNAVLSSTPEFYQVYNIKETDKMFVKEKDRVGLW